VTYRLAPSILSADFARLGEEIRAIEDGGADLIHFDVMDNHYVPNLTIGPLICEALRPVARIPIDVHIMAHPVDALVPMFAKAGAAIITVHPDGTTHLDRTLSLIRESECKAGLAINPATPLDVLDYVMDKLDLVLIMSVNPGFAGQAFIPEALHEIARVRAMIGERQILLEVDGGIKTVNIREVAQAGADTFVSGSAIFSARDADGGYRTVMGAMRRELEGVR